MNKKLKNSFLGLELFMVCFGSTTLVPILTGIPISTVLFFAGISTLLMHFFAKGKFGSPIVFLGSSFAYIAPILYITDKWDLNSVFFALGVAGVVKVIFSRIIKRYGSLNIKKLLFPPVVSGTMIMLIGLTLVNTGLDMASNNWFLAVSTLILVIIFMSFTKGITNLFSVLLAILGGYFIALLTGNVEFGTYQIIKMPQFQVPKVNIQATIYMLPFALAPMIEHFGDIFAISEATGNKYYKSPGMHRTMLIDGIGTMFSFFGSVPNTTYSEGTSAVNLLGIKSDKVSRNAGIFAVIFSFIGVLSTFLQSIPTSVIGGIMIILFGSIATLGLKSLISNEVDFNKSRNIIIASIMVVFGIGNITIWQFSGVGLAAMLGISLQIVFFLNDKYLKLGGI